MKILHIIKERTETGNVDTIIEDQTRLGNDVSVAKLWEDKDYDKLVEDIFANDKVYTW